MKAFALVGMIGYSNLKSVLEICFYRSRTPTFRCCVICTDSFRCMTP